MVIDGKKIAQEIIDKLKKQPKPEKVLAAVLIGKNLASISFLKLKEKTAKELGINFQLHKFPEDITADDLEKEVAKIANSKEVGGVVIQLPLPEYMDKSQILNVISQEKDVDVLSGKAIGAFINNKNSVLPPAVGVVEEILKVVNYQLLNVKCAVVGLGFLIGKPIASWLMNKAKEVYIINKGSDYKILKNADLIIAGVGKAGLIKPEMLKDGAGIIDFGVSLDKNGKLSGDFDQSLLNSHPSLLKFYTPTPGGTGPILIAKLMENFYILNETK